MKVINRRTEPRFATDGMAEMRVVLPDPGEIIDARICEISKSGLRIQTNQQLFSGSDVEILLSQILVSAEVCRCRQISTNLYEAGLKIVDVQEMSNSAIKWRHNGPGRMEGQAA